VLLRTLLKINCLPISGHKDKLIKTTEIQDNVVGVSTVLDTKTKQAFNQQSDFIRKFLTNNPKANAYQLKSLTSEILTYWNESINPDTERFWIEMKQNNIDFVRKEPLRFALAKGRFRNVEQGIEAKNYLGKLKHFPSFTNRYTQLEIERLDQIIEEDERKRLEVLKKCLAKNAIPQTQYLKFGECMAYFGRCHLFETYFSKVQVEELYTIWKDFESQ
jgi:hypothetical protein